MTTEEFRRRIAETEYLSKWVRHGTWKWNKDNSVTVIGDLDVNEYNATELNVKFRKVTGKCCIKIQPTLKNLENYPKSVGLYLYSTKIRHTSINNEEYKKLLKDAIKQEKLKRMKRK